MFQDLKGGNPIFIFLKDSLSAMAGEVVRIDNQIDQFGNKIYATGLMQPKPAYVDILVRSDGKERSFGHVAASATITDSGDPDGVILCDNRQEFIDAISAYGLNSERIVSEVDRHRQIAQRCREIVSQFDPRVKAEQERAEELSRMKDRMDRMENMMVGVDDKLSRILELGSKKSKEE